MLLQRPRHQGSRRLQQQWQEVNNYGDASGRGRENPKRWATPPKKKKKTTIINIDAFAVEYRPLLYCVQRTREEKTA
ncbi:hypothetical protein TRSC58_07228 [Trypanosoma rangeli SC58]|uniref:Uncharacterized protein n=1 Tax=Trypanosoma rangeli SC58 TaxID=429131 RepID=A0A061IRR8_TRYRA|nr:hypothetical protein TRSC58_07228 [Trypanosoma rangeli SC58]